MKTNNKFIYKHFKRYEKIKESEFSLHGGVRGDAYMAKRNTIKKTKQKASWYIKINERGEIEKSSLDSFEGSIPVFSTIVDDDLIERLSPNNIDSGYFWKKAIDTFPLLSVSYSPKSQNKSEVNDSNLKHQEKIGAIGIVDKIFSENSNAKMLEIGPGHGAVTGYVASTYGINNYYAIDVFPLFKLKNLYKTDGKTIPAEIPKDLDIVYSVNVFQHLSQEQRLSYYKQISERLVVGGKFVFSMFLVTPKTENIIYKGQDGIMKTLFGFRDKQGSCYVNFFSQFTRCNTGSELVEIFGKLNMKIEVISNETNSFCLCATKM